MHDAFAVGVYIFFVYFKTVLGLSSTFGFCDGVGR
jgi:hypothetical protein